MTGVIETLTTVEWTAVFFFFRGGSLQTQVLLALVIYLHATHYEKKKVPFHLIGITGLYAGSLLASYAVYRLSGNTAAGASEGNSLPLTLTFCIATYGLLVVCAWCFREMSWLEAVYMASCAYLTQHFTRCLYMLISGGKAESDSSYYITQIICMVFVYGICLFWFAGELIEDGEKQRRSRQGLMTPLAALAMAIILSAYAQRISSESSRLYAVCMVYGMVCCFYVLWDQAARKKQQNLQDELELQRQTFQKYKEQYQMSQDTVTLINRKCHDLKHQIAALRHISSEEQRNEQIRSLENSVMIYDSMVHTDNEVLDTLLTEKSLYCEANGITLTCVADGKSVAFMDPVDIYTIFGNALDNALECVARFENPQMRVISVIVTARAGMILFQFENYYEDQLKVTADGFATTKDQNGYHGFGLKSIRYAAEKYGGMMHVETEGGIFLLQVMVPMTAANKKSS